MDSATYDNTDIRPPQDDGSVKQAMDDFDAKLAAWMAALRAAQSQFQKAACAGTRPPKAAVNPSSGRRSAPTGPPKSVESGGGPQPALQDIPSCAESAPATESVPDPAEDEAFLASLDAETAQALRIMRRLTPERKSARELLRHYQPSQPSAPTKDAPRTSRFPWGKVMR